MFFCSGKPLRDPNIKKREVKVKIPPNIEYGFPNLGKAVEMYRMCSMDSNISALNKAWSRKPGRRT